MKKFIFFLLLCTSVFANEYEETINEVPKIDDEQKFLVNENFRKTKEALKKKVETLSDLDIDSTATEIDQVIDGVGATVTAANLDTLTDGSNADALHTHSTADWDYDSGWFTANVNTLYTKAHGISMTFPTNMLQIQIAWRASSGGSYMTNCLRFADAAENTEGMGYNGSNLYVKMTYIWAKYYDSAGNSQVAGNGQLRILARKVT